VILGSRSSYFPWISLADWVGLVVFALGDESIAGPLNCVSPNPVTQGEFAEGLARKLGKRVWGSVPRWMLRLGAGEFGESMTYSQRAIPERALGAGFEFATKLSDSAR
jgi:NAD dependent epimerase/dehydratase family enzyme